ncbi:DmsC/YnfH family molybdoenzyme membrane anchor subunit [Desulfosporosinus sp. PR]|uniref:dimethyl sulfoxide reductase anchor subunit family protein n=1 Tax=Candidatus Desulfosporosinus nitrosoreducens TaxID=3401928 RepID=UPI0027EB991F|nr:DmsC/YnfH family molybdoenzyme membrane anchor subunit [Desulfosporosinus sp. PR]MDQ7095151.1 DmsC/YnfH family molybdoenzyme membrane anchor subunit [Desulfosporosinus sp. PR]
MFAEEWPLMMFTLISQLAIGSFIILVFVRAFLTKQDAPMAVKLTNPGFKAVGVLMVLSLIFSLFHLGTPSGAYRSILNLASSWLSREILTAGGFLVFWFASYRSYQKNNASALGWITSLIGLAAVFSMVNIYSHSVRPAWTNVNTYIAFYGAMLALGSLGAAAMIAYASKGTEVSSSVIAQLKKVNIIAGAAVILPLVYLPVYINGLANGDAAAQASSQLLTGSYVFLLILRGLISLVGAGLLFYAIRQIGKKTAFQNWVYGALVLIFMGEFIGRYVFYGSAVSIMIGLN